MIEIPWHWNHERVVRHLLCEILVNQENQMAALDNLNTNIADLKTSVDTLLAQPAGVAEASVQAAADAVAVVTAEVKAKLPTPPPAPAA